MGIQFNPKVEPRLQQAAAGQQLGRLGGLTTMTPRVAPVSTGNEMGISIPQNHSYTSDENGNKISMGLDGVGLAHRNPKDYNFMMIA